MNLFLSPTFLGLVAALHTERGAVALVSPQTIILEQRARKRTMALAGNSHDSTGISGRESKKGI